MRRPTQTAEAPSPPSSPEGERKKGAAASPAGRTWLEMKLRQAEREQKLGPGLAGWTHNEARRGDVNARVAFLRALIALLPV